MVSMGGSLAGAGLRLKIVGIFKCHPVLYYNVVVEEELLLRIAAACQTGLSPIASWPSFLSFGSLTFPIYPLSSSHYGTILRGLYTSWSSGSRIMCSIV